MELFNVINSHLQRLSHIHRYSALPVHRKETVAEHTFFCAMYAFMVANDLKRRGYEISPEIAVVKALHHDLEEYSSADIINVYKNTTPELRDEIDRADDIAMRRLEKQMGGAYEELYEVWRSSKDDSLEGRVVELCDRLCLVVYVREELLMGNEHLEPVAVRAQALVKKAASGEELGPYYKDIYPSDNWKDIKRGVTGQYD